MLLPLSCVRFPEILILKLNTDLNLARSDVCEQMVNKLEVDPCPSTDNLTVSSNPSSIWDAMLAYNHNNKCIETGNKNVADLIKVS